MNPRLPERVSGRYLSFSEREDVVIWHDQKVSAREIARRLKRDPSTISRELRRGASTRTYELDDKATTAQWHAQRRARRPKVAKLVADPRLRDYVQARRWSRRSGRMRRSDEERSYQHERSGGRCAGC